ncbi:hypothetical protein ABZ700_27615 [Streptomyces diastaticus]|uniref:hypothetical protein n=1 Tax=Streptomyces diastaticus TaxID=1956 RepID=UPI003405FF75
MTRTWIPGACWLCDADDVPVLWLGPLQEDGQTAPLYACGPCVDRLRARAAAYHAARDEAPAK